MRQRKVQITALRQLDMGPQQRAQTKLTRKQFTGSEKKENVFQKENYRKSDESNSR